jgi:hypothetical protein
MLAREVEDEDSGKHLILNHPILRGFGFREGWGSRKKGDSLKKRA